MPPPLSVVMPVHNALPYLEEAVASILAQSHADFEYVIRDDGSTDGSTEVLRALAARDRRIRLFEGGEKLGPTGSSNWVVAQAQAPLVARMDADDVSHPDRFRRQMNVFAARPEAGLVASAWEGIDSDGRIVRGPDRARLLRKSPFAPFTHGSVMFRREVFDAVGGYRAECDYWEDIDLFLHMAELAPALVITDPLYRHRFAETSTRLVSGRAQVESAIACMEDCLSAWRRGESYDLLLRAGPPARVDPHAFVSAGSPILWAGRRPRVFTDLVRRGRLRLDRETFAVILWALCADLAPLGLRSLLNARLRRRDRVARRRLGDIRYVEWDPRDARSA